MYVTLKLYGAQLGEGSSLTLSLELLRTAVERCLLVYAQCPTAGLSEVRTPLCPLRACAVGLPDCWCSSEPPPTLLSVDSCNEPEEPVDLAVWPDGRWQLCSRNPHGHTVVLSLAQLAAWSSAAGGLGS